ncbi:TRAP transporter small permease [Oceanibaculum nanhaiense]|uniref:TRAP transporter small permease n=1 Tax=Oceanibaculum nanhaiense TaxID=1909734 RepID=UPI00396D47AE
MIDRIGRGLFRLEAGLAALFLCLIVSCVFGQFFGRTVLNLGLHWTGELARFAFVWCGLLGAAAALQAGALHRVDMLSRRLSGVSRRLLEGLVLGLVLFVLAYLMFYGVRMTLRVVPQLSSTMEISMAWVYAALPVAVAGMILSTLLSLSRLMAGFDPSESDPR